MVGSLEFLGILEIFLDYRILGVGRKIFYGLVAGDGIGRWAVDAGFEEV